MNNSNKLTTKQKAEIVQGAKTATARSTDDKFAQFWAELTSDDPAIHGNWVKRRSLIRPRKG